MKEEILQFKITLAHSDPPVWRRFIVHNDITFQELHGIIQEVMGWLNYHMFTFQVKKDYIPAPDTDASLFGEESPYANEVCIYERLKKVGQKFFYIYDFADNWEHEILLEKRLPIKKEMTFPLCIDGERACPPEDYGGIMTYLNEEIEDFDPEYFNIEKINNNLRKLRW